MLRPLWRGFGLVALGVGIVGLGLPIVPTVPFLILAAFCFSRSDPEWAERLRNHPRYGSHLREWRDRRAISRKGKISAILAMAAGVVFSWYALGHPYVWISVVVLLVAGSWIWTRTE